MNDRYFVMTRLPFTIVYSEFPSLEISLLDGYSIQEAFHQ